MIEAIIILATGTAFVLWRGGRYRFVAAERSAEGACMITCEYRFLWGKPRLEHFVGDCIVWHSYPDFKRQPTHLELWLSDHWRRWKYEVAA